MSWGVSSFLTIPTKRADAAVGRVFISEGESPKNMGLYQFLINIVCSQQKLSLKIALMVGEAVMKGLKSLRDSVPKGDNFFALIEYVLQSIRTDQITGLVEYVDAGQVSHSQGFGQFFGPMVVQLGKPPVAVSQIGSAFVESDCYDFEYVGVGFVDSEHCVFEGFGCSDAGRAPLCGKVESQIFEGKVLDVCSFRALRVCDWPEPGQEIVDHINLLEMMPSFQ